MTSKPHSAPNVISFPRRLHPKDDLKPPYYERACNHGLSFEVHCLECSMEGFCGCRTCVRGDTA